MIKGWDRPVSLQSVYLPCYTPPAAVLRSDQRPALEREGRTLVVLGSAENKHERQKKINLSILRFNGIEDIATQAKHNIC